MSHNTPLSDAPRLTQKFGRETTTILTQGGLPYQAIGEVKINKNKLQEKLRIEYTDAISKSDYKKAFKLVKNACEQGNDTACWQVKAIGGYKKGSESVTNIIDEWNYYRLEGYRYWYHQNMSKAIELFNLAIKLKPKNHLAYYELSTILIDAKQYKEAFDVADRIMKYEPAVGYFLRAMVLWHQGDTKNSISEFTKSCKIKKSPGCDHLDEAALISKQFEYNFRIAGIEMLP